MLDLYGSTINITVETWAGTFGPSSFLIGAGIEQTGPKTTDSSYAFPYTLDVGTNYMKIIPTYGYGLGEGTVWDFKFLDRALESVNVNTNFGGFSLDYISFPTDSEMLINFSSPVSYQPTGSYLSFDIGVAQTAPIPEPSQALMMGAILLLAGAFKLFKLKVK
jgi:hypothetical protein